LLRAQMQFRTLIVDDEETYALSLKRLLLRRGVDAQVAGTAQGGLAAARAGGFDLVILDHMLPDGNGLDLISPIRALRPPPTVLMMTAYGTIENAVEAMRRGASDYVTKSTELPAIVERVVEAERIARMKTEVELRALNPTLAEAARMPELLGNSAAMREVRERVAEVARAQDTTVLLSGESGTGKGVVARAIHALRSRSSRSIALRCRRRSPKASSSVTRRARSPAPIRRSPASSKPSVAARCSSTRSATWSSCCKGSSYACSKSARSIA
jgi:DNA-binding NtrC family response regulator